MKKDSELGKCKTLHPAGSKVDFKAKGIIGYNDGDECRGYILHRRQDGRYFVELASGGYTFINETDILDGGLPAAPQSDVDAAKIVFFGNGARGAEVLRGMIRCGMNIVAVVTSPPTDRRYSHTHVESLAAESGITILYFRDNDTSEVIKGLKRIDGADLGVVSDFKRIPGRITDMMQYGIIGVHYSLLPRWRGASPVTAALQSGDDITGVTTFLIDDDLDTGNVIDNISVPVNDDDTCGTLQSRLNNVALLLLERSIALVLAGDTGVPQKRLWHDFTEFSYTTRIRRNDCSIDWLADSAWVNRFIRSFSPSPGAYGILDTFNGNSCGERFIILDCKVADCGDREERAPGEMYSSDGRLFVMCADKAVEILRLRRQSRRECSALDFINGNRRQARGFFRLDRP